jgi:hypothetical protein
MMIDHWATVQKMLEDTGLTPAEILALPADEYARLSNRATPVESAVAALGYADEPAAPSAPQSVPQPPADAGQGIDPNSAEYFLAWRDNRVSGGEGRGIFDSVGSRSDAYTSAVRRHAGRGALSSANVVEPPRVDGRYVRQDDMRDTRPAAERFSTPGNAFNFYR